MGIFVHFLRQFAFFEIFNLKLDVFFFYEKREVLFDLVPVKN